MFYVTELSRPKHIELHIFTKRSAYDKFNKKPKVQEVKGHYHLKAGVLSKTINRFANEGVYISPGKLCNEHVNDVRFWFH